LEEGGGGGKRDGGGHVLGEKGPSPERGLKEAKDGDCIIALLLSVC
jgi:hypothetical protein